MLVKIKIKLNNTNEVILNIKYKMIQTSEYKYIEYKNDEVVITHDVLEEYEEETSNENLTYEMYKNKIMHMVLAPRNIGIDKLGDYQLIDLNDIHIFKNDK
jgi:hypothetical protein